MIIESFRGLVFFGKRVRKGRIIHYKKGFIEIHFQRRVKKLSTIKCLKIGLFELVEEEIIK